MVFNANNDDLAAFGLRGKDATNSMFVVVKCVRRGLSLDGRSHGLHGRLAAPAFDLGGFLSKVIITEGLSGSGIGEALGAQIVELGNQARIGIAFHTDRGQLVFVILCESSVKLNLS